MNYPIRWKRRLRALYIQVRTTLQPSFQSHIWAGERGDPAHLNYLNELDNERNKILWEVLETFHAQTVVEIGSSLGSKIIGFAKDNPEVKLVGLDINPKAVEKGRLIAGEMQLDNLTFEVFDIAKDSISGLKLEMKSAVIFSWATLIYVHPMKINRVINSVISQEPLGFVFIEQHSDSLAWFWKRGKIISGGPNYIRDYRYLISRTDRSSKYQVTSTQLAPDIWGPGGGNASIIIGRRTD
jgi:SAM-dependent methyltransferase